MALDFPSSPTNGQSFGAFTYDSSLPGWRSTPEVASGLAAGTMVQWPGATPPANWLICDGSAISRANYASLFSAIGTQYGVGDGSTTFNLPDLKGKVAVGLDSAQTEFNVLGETGGAKTHTLQTSEMPSHTHVQDSHNHTQNSHNHTQDSHNHTQNSHNHTQDSHNHTQNAHGHNFSFGGTQYASWSYSTAFGGNISFAAGTATGTTQTSIAGNTATNNATTATNQATTATNNATTATNQATTATNNATTATNQNTGGGGAHNNLQPYIVLNYIIKTSAGVTAGDSELATRVGATETRATALETRATNLEAKSPNYLLNGGFDIWQRGDTIGQNSKCGADQWYYYYFYAMSQLRITSGIPANSTSAMRVRSDLNGNLAVGVMQVLETKAASSLWGKQVTFSMKMRRSSTMSQPLTLLVYKHANVDQTPSAGTWTNISSVSIPNANIPTGTTSSDWYTASITVTIPADGTANTLWFEVRATGGMDNGVYYEIAEAQVELGPVATAFRRNSPNPQAELVACQRYYWRFTQVDNYYMFNSATCWSSGGEMIVNVPLPTTQRVTGTHAMTNISSIYWLGNGTNLSGATSPSYRPTKEAFVLVCTVPGQTATNTWSMRPLVNSYLESSAEL